MGLFYLAAAICAEVAGTTCMKMSEQFTRLIPSVAMFVLYGISLTLLSLALKGIPVSVAYAVWSGLGTALIAVVGIMWFHEPAGTWKLIWIGVIIVGAVGLNLSGGGHG